MCLNYFKAHNISTNFIYLIVNSISRMLKEPKRFWKTKKLTNRQDSLKKLYGT